MPIRILPASEKRKAKRGEFRTTKGKGTKDLRDRLKEITLKTRPPKPDIRKTLTDAFAGGIKGKPHSSPSGQAASVGRTIRRLAQEKQKEYQSKWPKREPMVPLKIGGPAAGKGTKDLRDRLKEITSRTRPGIHERLGGGVKAKPHSTREGRIASGKRKIKRIFSQPSPKRKLPPKYRGKPTPMSPGRPSTSIPKWRHEERIMTPLRAKHAIGGIAKIIGKKAVDWIKKNRKTIRKEVYSPEGKKKTKDMLDKLKKKYPDSQMFGPKKAKGGPVRPIHIPWPKKRAKKGHGGSAQSHYLQHGYGPHKIQLRSGKPKLAKKGW